MINSILDRHHEPVIFHNIRTPTELIHQPTQIKQQIQSHYENWTKYNPPNHTEWPKWQLEYQPKQHILRSWYHDLEKPITIEELTTTINNSPNSKAPGPNNISNEMLKKAGTIFHHTLLNLFNKCLKEQTIPKN